MSKVNYMSKDGFNKLREELKHLKSIERQKIAEAISEAREKGDLSENAEYDAAKEAQGLLELKISEMDMIVANCRIIDETNIDTSQVSVFTNVRMKNLKFNKEITYKLVSSAEANIKEKKISVTSPIGEGLLGKIVGDTVEITTPGGIVAFEILEISL